MISRAIGKTTNNDAESSALVAGFTLAPDRGAKSLEVRSDSELIVRKMTGAYRVKHPQFKVLWLDAQELAKKFNRYSIRRGLRGENQRADELTNRALDEAQPHCRDSER